MPEHSGFLCSCCGQHHDGLPMSFAAPAPDFWTLELAEDPESELTSETCVIKGQAFFVHGLIEIPVADTGEVFSWGVWVSLSQDNFTRALRLWNTPGRENEPPYFGWLSTGERALYVPSGRTIMSAWRHGVHPSTPMSRRPPSRLRASQYTEQAGPPSCVPEGVSAKVLRQIEHASRRGACPSVQEMGTALQALAWFLGRQGRTLTLDPDTTCPCHDPRDALDTLHVIIQALPNPGRRQVEAVMAPLVEQFRERTLPDPLAPGDQPWWRRRITER